MSRTRKGNIELIRFIASIGIMLGHATLLSGNYDALIHPFPRGYLYVELFFMLTGCFSAAHVDEREIEKDKPMKYAARYTIIKLYHILPFSMIGVVICYIWRFVFVTPSYEEAVSLLIQAPFELLLLNITGLSTAYLNAPLWYLSVLLIALPMIMYLMIKQHDLFRNYLSWAFPLVIYGFLLTNFEALNVWGNSPIFLVSLFRAIAGLSLGSCVYYYSAMIRMDNKKHCITLGLLEVLLYLCAIYATYVNINIHRIDIAVVLLFFAGLLLSYSGITYTAKLNHRAVIYLGRLSSLIYCFHWGIFVLAQSMMPEVSFRRKLFISIMVTLTMSVVILLIHDKIKAIRREKGKGRRG